MYYKPLTNRILEQRKKSTSDDVIKTMLQEESWSQEDIDTAFYYANNPKEIKNFSIKRFFQSDVKESTFLVSMLCILVAAMTTFFFLKKDSVYAVAIAIPSHPEMSKVTFTYGVQPNLSHPDFFAKVKNQLIEKNTTFIEVNLSEMKVRVYKQGTTTLEVPVKTKGKEGSWWETPAGLYKIESKAKSHYSSIGHVTQPWSMQFQGNFFIHGWPHYDDGSPVSSSFSGGCIRLTDEDAKKLYDQVTIGTPILVYEKDFIPDTHTYSEIKPEIRGTSYMAADILNNYIFLEQNRSEQVSAKYITKFMTALIATEYINIEKNTTIKTSSLVETEVPRLTQGMTINVYQLLFPLLRESSNEAAEAIATLYGKGGFVKHMNQKAKAIGMNNTTFVDPTGASEGNITTPEDIFMLAKYIYNNRSFLFNITSGKVKTSTYGESVFSNLKPASVFTGQPTFFGGISGDMHNIALFETNIGTTTRPILFISLNSLDPSSDIEESKQYIIKKFK